MAKLGITEHRELRTLEAVAKAGQAGAEVVALAGAGQIAGATAEALSRKSYVKVEDGKPRRAFLTPDGATRLAELRSLAVKASTSRKR